MTVEGESALQPRDGSSGRGLEAGGRQGETPELDDVPGDDVPDVAEGLDDRDPGAEERVVDRPILGVHGLCEEVVSDGRDVLFDQPLGGALVEDRGLVFGTLAVSAAVASGASFSLWRRYRGLQNE